MTVASFRRCVALKTVKDGEREWLPKWLSSYAKFHGVEGEDTQLEMDEARVIAFLRSLRDRKVEAWRRLQATRAMELYQHVILRTPNVDFLPIRKKLMEIAAAEKANPGISPGASDMVAGEGNAGKIKRTDSEAIQEMQPAWPPMRSKQLSRRSRRLASSTQSTSVRVSAMCICLSH